MEVNVKDITVSIITPCFNSESSIRDTIESVLYQTYRNIEYIIVDGASTDSTTEIIEEYVPLFQGRLRYVSEPDKGIYNAMNKGIKMSHGQLIGIINSDDYYETDAVEKMVRHYNKGEYQVLYGYMRVMSHDRIRYICKDSHKQLLKSMIPHPTCFISRNIYSDFGLYLERFRLVADYELMLRINKTGRINFQCIPEIITNYREGGASASKRTFYEVSLVRFLYGGLSCRELVNKLINDSLVK